MPRLAMLGGLNPVMSCPQLDRPLVGGTKPESRLNKVVFPAPFGPMIAWIGPALIDERHVIDRAKTGVDLESPFVSTIAARRHGPAFSPAGPPGLRKPPPAREVAPAAGGE